MRKFLSSLVFVLVAVVQAPPALAGSGSVPVGSHAFGASRVAWAEDYSQWLLGDSSNPAFTSDCGAVVDGVFFLNTAFAPGAEYNCTIAMGTPIVLAHAAYYAWVPVDGSTDQEIVATAHDLFGDPESSLILDGKNIPLQTTETGAFNVVSEPGSAYDAIFGLGTGAVRTAFAGEITVLHPLSRGQHELAGVVDFTPYGGPVLDVTYHIAVR